MESYSSPRAVSIGEDATRLISCIDYDNETDRLVGFVLPCDDNRLPLPNSYIAAYFESTKKSFTNGQCAKYASVYKARPLGNYTNLLLSVYGSTFFSEYKKVGIDVISFGVDSDSCELKSM